MIPILNSVFILIFIISFVLAAYLDHEGRKRTATVFAISTVTFFIMSAGTFIYALSIADVNVRCHHYEVVDIREGETNMLVLKTDQGGYFEREASLADQYELDEGDDYWLEESVSSVEGVVISVKTRYAYTCKDGPIERGEQ